MSLLLPPVWKIAHDDSPVFAEALTGSAQSDFHFPALHWHADIEHTREAGQCPDVKLALIGSSPNTIHFRTTMCFENVQRGRTASGEGRMG